jgi:hypothetical protein
MQRDGDRRTEIYRGRERKKERCRETELNM